VQNSRIDYLQQIEYSFGRDEPQKPQYYSNSKSLPLRLHRGQRAVLQLNEVTLEPSEKDSCQFVPERKRDQDLLKVSIGRTKFLTCPQTISGNCSAALDKHTWKTFDDEFRSAADPMYVEVKGDDLTVTSTLKMERAEDIMTACGLLHVVGVLAIFKDTSNPSTDK